MTLFAHAAPAEWPQAALQFGSILPGSDRLSMIRRGSIYQFPCLQPPDELGIDFHPRSQYTVYWRSELWR